MKGELHEELFMSFLRDFLSGDFSVGERSKMKLLRVRHKSAAV